MIQSREFAVIQIVPPGNAVQGVLRANEVSLRTLAGAIRATGQQRAAQSDDADRIRQAQS
jgi:hypothetical protein